MNQNTLKSLRPMILVFILLNAFFMVGKSWLAQKGVDQDVLVIGNLVLFLVSLLSFLLTSRSLKSDNHHAFVRAVYSGFIIKFFVVALAAFVYIMLAENGINKPALFICMALYFVYAFLEVSPLLRVLKQKKNG